MCKQYSSTISKFVLLICCILLLPHQAKTQESPYLTSNRLEISIAPLSLFDYTPRFRMGIEYYSHEKIGFSFDMGYGNNSLNAFADQNRSEDYELTEYRAQVNYFIILKKQIAFYMGPELFFIQTRDVMNNSYLIKPEYPPGSPTNLATHYQQADYYRQKVGLNYKLGLKLIFWKQLTFDVYAGIGIAHRKIEYSHIINPEDMPLGALRGLLIGNHITVGEKYIPHLALGAKVGIILWEKEKDKKTKQ